MKKLLLLKEWEDPKGAKGAELRATWGALTIKIAAPSSPVVLTRLLDKQSNSERDRIYAPLYPIAEWLAFNWYQLLHGTKARDSERNHNLRHAAEGFAFPRLSIWSEGSTLRLEWEAGACQKAGVDFLESGNCTLPREFVEQELADFITGVLLRLEEHSLSGTPLQTEWEALGAMDSEQRRFCAAAATLGFDPFNLPEDVESRILSVATLLSPSMQDEFFPVAREDRLVEEAEAIQRAAATTNAHRSQSPRIEATRAVARPLSPASSPWKQGYELAAATREALGIPAGPLAEGILEELIHPTINAELAAAPGIEGLVARNGTSTATAINPLLASRHPSYRHFIMARSLYEHMVSSPGSNAILTTSSTSRQRINRAFAAEFLAPASDIAKRIQGPWVNDSIVEEIADVFGVSSMTIMHQISNHGLARIES